MGVARSREICPGGVGFETSSAIGGQPGATDDARSRAICPGGAAFETRSARGDMDAVLVKKAARPVINGVSVLVIGNWLGL